MCLRGQKICAVDRENILLAVKGQRGLGRTLSTMNYAYACAETILDLQKHLSSCRYAALLVGTSVVPTPKLKNFLEPLRKNDQGIAIIAHLDCANGCFETKLFDVGVDDVVVGSIHPKALAKRLAMRIKARTPNGKIHGTIRLGKALVDMRNLRVWNHGREHRISKGLAALLHFFLENRGRVITRQEILESLWADSVLDPEGKNVDMQISKLRRIVESDPKKPVYLRTVRGVGYEARV